MGELRELQGLAAFCEERKVSLAYVVTRDPSDFSVMPLGTNDETRVLKIPAPLACYWLGRSELEQG